MDEGYNDKPIWYTVTDMRVTRWGRQAVTYTDTQKIDPTSWSLSSSSSASWHWHTNGMYYYDTMTTHDLMIMTCCLNFIFFIIISWHNNMGTLTQKFTFFVCVTVYHCHSKFVCVLIGLDQWDNDDYERTEGLVRGVNIWHACLRVSLSLKICVCMTVIIWGNNDDDDDTHN